ncbi:hypothetical protein [Caballeronia sp. LZ016]|uniref:hypothetical protein n=1 Tax=Caballeronia sp. LZ016 TaxID=3038554 RepID=UPI00285BE374|nr:hypothetical protein [Caballeronia sp. LZ016]MDR5741406.1 hypothetical protein [Caballeronia sp. LZ016]
MFNSAILEVAIGIVFIYMLLSLMCTALREGLEGLLKTRASYLENGIRELLFDLKGENLAKAFYEHPLVFSLFAGEYASPAPGKIAGALTRGKSLPSYIPARNFAAALMDIVARGSGRALVSTETVTVAGIRGQLALMDNPAVQRAVLAALDTAHDDLDKARKNLERWYDSAMDRVSGRYRRSTQWVLFWIGLVMSVGFNVDTLTLADYLYRNETQRGAIVAQAGSIARDASGLPVNFKDVKEQIDELRLPIGWDFVFNEKARQSGTRTNLWNEYHAYFTKPLGWLLTAFAITLGAPFWFDVLNRIMVVRSTVKPHEKSPEEASEDRQA